MISDDNPLLDDITKAVRRSFDEFRDRVGQSELIGYAICSDDTANSCAPIAASKSGLAAFSAGSPADFRFNPEEWDVYADLDELRTVNNTIYALCERSEDYEHNDNWHQEYRSYIYGLLVGALKRLDADGYFGTSQDRDGIFVIAWIIDSVLPKQLGSGWSQQLNCSDIHNAFTEWLASTNYWG